jgi:O-antigen/teichoic acid export membrane protein
VLSGFAALGVSVLQGVPVNFWYLFALSVSQGLSIFLQELAKYNASKKRFLFTQLSAPALLMCSTLLLILLFENITIPLALVALILAYFIAHLISLFFIKNTFLRNQKPVKFTNFFPSLAKFSGFKILSVFANYFDKFLIITLFAPIVAGYIAVCMTLESVSSKLFTFLSNMEMNALANRIEKQRVVSKLVILSFILGGIGLVFSLLFGHFVLTLLFGAEFSPAYQFLNIIIFVSVANGIAWVASQRWIIEQRYMRIYSRQLFGIAVVLIGGIYVALNDADAISFLYVMSLSSLLRFIFTFYFYIKDLRGNEV